MNLSSGVSLGQLILAFGVMLVTGGVAWGALMQRVKTLEHEVEALSGFSATLARIDERLSNLVDDVKDIKGSWLMKDPPGYTALNPHRSQP